MPSGFWQSGGVGDGSEAALALSQAVPNPAGVDGAVIRYSLSHQGWAELAVYDLRGSRVRTLLAGSQPAGAGDVRWDGRDARGAAASSGLHFYRLTLDGRSLSGRLVLAR